MKTDRTEISKAEVVDQFRALGVQIGSVLLVHAAFRAVRPIEGGPCGLIEALQDALGPDGTLVMPSMSEDDDVPFDPATHSVMQSLGVVADTFWRMPGVLRSDHPAAFAALGPQATAIVSGPLPLPPHVAESPVGHVHDLDGQVLLLGIGHDANTTLHLAELIVGVPYGVPRYCTVLRDGRPVRIDYRENDHCCVRFALAHQWLGDRQRQGRVGHAQARLMGSRDIVRVAVENLKRDPLVFLHPADAGCAECNAARASI